MIESLSFLIGKLHHFAGAIGKSFEHEEPLWIQCHWQNFCGAGNGRADINCKPEI